MNPRRTKRNAKRTRKVSPYSAAVSLQFFKKANQNLRLQLLRQQRVNNVLKENAQRWKTIFSNAQDGILIADVATKKFLKSNIKIREMLEYSESELLSLSVKDIHPPEGLKRAVAGFTHLAKGKTSTVTDIPIKRRDGSVFYADISSSFVRFLGRECLVGFFRDITERKQANAVLKESEERYRSLIETTHTGYVILDHKGKVLDANKEYLRFAGYKHLDQICGKSVIHWTADHEKAKNIKAIQKCLSKGRIRDFETAYVDRQGRITPILINATVMKVKGAIRILSLCRDITDRKQVEKALRQESSFRKAIIENQPGMVWLKDNNGRFLTVNQKFAKACGMKFPDHVVGKTDFDIWPEKLARKYRADDQKVMKNRGFLRTEGPIRDHGVLKWYETFKTVILDATGQIIGTSGYAQDISERKRAEEAVQESEERYRILFDGITDGVLVHGITDDGMPGSFLTANNIACKLLGYTREEFLRMSPRDLDAPESTLNVRAIMARLKRSERVLFEQIHVAKDGRHIPVEINVQTVHLQKRPVILSVVRDITERKKAEDALRQAEERYRELVEGTDDLITIVDAKGRFIYVNHSAQKIFGIKPKGCIGRLAFDFVHPADREKTKKAFEGWVRGGKKQVTFQNRQVNKNGKIFEMLWNINLHFNDSGEVVRISNFARDITELRRAEEVLRENEEKLRLMFEKSPIGIAMCEMDGTFVEANRAFLNIIGYTRKEALKLGYWDVTPKEYADDEEKQLRSMKETGKYGPYEKEYIRKTGERIPIVLNGAVVTGADGVERIWSLVEDVTERKKAENLLKESERSLLEAQTISGLGSYSLDVPSGVWTSSPVLDTIFGINKQYKRSVEGWLKLLHPDWREGVRDYFEKEVLGKRSSFDKEYKIVRVNDGQERWVHGLGELELDAKGRPIKMIGTIMDITVRKYAEEALRESRHQLLQIIDTVPHMIFAKDRKGRFLLVNRAVAEAYDKEPKELIGVRRQDVHKVREESKAYLKLDREILATGKPRIVPEDPFTDIQGRRHILQTIKIPFKMVGIKEDCILGVSVDVTEQKRIEEFRNDIVRTVSHELRTPLSIEKEGVSLLLDEVLGAVNPEQKEILETIMRSINRLSRMISSLLDISRIETGKIELRKEKTELRDLVRDVAFEFKRRAEEKGIDLSAKLPEAPVSVFADSDRITQVLSNLVDNAIKFTPEKGTVEISLVISKGSVECSVRDTGIGISPENKHKIFEKFQQFGRTVGPGEKGLGLGLSIVKGIVDMHGGKIRVQSESGKGTCVTFTLPLFNPKGVS